MQTLSFLDRSIARYAAVYRQPAPRRRASREVKCIPAGFHRNTIFRRVILERESNVIRFYCNFGIAIHPQVSTCLIAPKN